MEGSVDCIEKCVVRNCFWVSFSRKQPKMLVIGCYGQVVGISRWVLYCTSGIDVVIGLYSVSVERQRIAGMVKMSNFVVLEEPSMSLKINIDNQSGFCFGVVKAIEMAENHLSQGDEVWCLGQIVHNQQEVERLLRLGMKQTSLGKLGELTGGKVLIRAHGEPPSTYHECSALGLTVVDATCPLVLRLQKSVALAAEAMRPVGGQIVIFGKTNHPEVVGLAGQATGVDVFVVNATNAQTIDCRRPTRLFSQTTMDAGEYHELIGAIKACCKASNNFDVEAAESVCAQVSRRRQGIQAFASSNDVVLFVTDPKSSNGKVLFDQCLSANPRTYFVTGPHDLNPVWFANAQTIGISGATSTPGWLIRQIAEAVRAAIQS